MGCKISFPKEGPREPPEERAESRARREHHNKVKETTRAREYRDDALAGWACIPCHHYNDGERSNSKNCSRCQVTVESHWDVLAFDDKNKADLVVSANLASNPGWYHSICKKHYDSVDGSQECSNPPCGNVGGEVWYTCRKKP